MKTGSGGILLLEVMNPDSLIRMVVNGAGMPRTNGIQKDTGIIILGTNGTLNGRIFMAIDGGQENEQTTR